MARTNTDRANGSSSPIQKFFTNTTIFVTGGTGFLGILLVEKLLYSCPDINKIYMLVRGKKGKTVQSRLDELFDDVVFSRLRQQYPDFRKKIVPVEGDCELLELGLNTQDRAILKEEVDIVFHLAATVRFDEGLKKASFINIRAVRDILKLAQEMPKLKSFVHVSTAYSNCIHSHIKEEIYPPATDYRELLKVVESLSDDVLNIITPKFLGEFPNTYSFTKQIAEDIVRQEAKGLPIGIHRPSIVISTYLEPLKGWINNLYGPTGVIACGGVGLIRAAYVNPVIKANLVPADLTINSIIASAWDIAECYAKDTGAAKDVPVYNFESGLAPALTWISYTRECLNNAEKYCPVRMLWYQHYVACYSRFSFLVVDFFLHKIPAFLVDTLRFCMGKPPMLMKVYKKIDKMMHVLDYFKLREWTFDSKSIEKLKNRMSEEDRETFFFELRSFNWSEYFDYYAQGIRVYLLKDPLDTIPEGQKVYRRFYWIHQITKTVVILVSLWVLWWLFSLVFKF